MFRSYNLYRKLLLLGLLIIISCNESSSKSNSNFSNKNVQNHKTKLNGDYRIFGFTKTEKALKDSIEFLSMPDFNFTKDSVKIYPDFNFEYFKDSVYGYKMENHFLILEGKNDTKKIEYIESGSDIYKLYINRPYLNQITLRKNPQ